MKSHFVELTGIGQSHLAEEEIEVENLADNEAIIKAEYSMISAGTELSRAYGLKKGFSYPVRPGYCMVGKIIKRGKDIEAEPGERVFVNAPHASLVRRENGTTTQGPQIIKLPDGIDPLQATAINLFLVAIQGVNLTQVKLGNTVAVFGLGNIGILTALMYQKMGCRVIGLDIVPERCELAEKMGLENVISDRDQKQSIKRYGNIDISVDATGLSPVIMTAVDVTRQYGQVLLLGSPRESYSSDVMPFLSAIHMKNLQIIGGFNQSAPIEAVEGSNNSVKRNFKVVCDLIMNRDIDVSKMITEVIDPKNCQKAYHDLMYEKGSATCIVYDWNNY